MQVQRQPRRRSIAYQPDLGCSVSFRVRYYETDAMGVVHHSNYLPDIHEGMLACLQRDQLVLQNGSSPASAPAEF